MMTFAEFSKKYRNSNQQLYLRFYHQFESQFQVKNPKLAVKKLTAIMTATFKLSHNNSFSNISMRTLSKEAKLSIGGLYSYFSKKEKIAQSIHEFLISYSKQIFNKEIDEINQQTLSKLIRTHLYISEIMLPWFFFTFMESKNLKKSQRTFARNMEQSIEKKIEDIIELGQQKGWYNKNLSAKHLAALVKPLLHDWYLKRGKYKTRKASVDQYADSIIQFINHGIMNDHQ